MNYNEYIAYHKQGDAGVEERMIASICRYYKLSEWDSFRLIYFYTMTYHIPSALRMLIDGERNIKNLQFRTDRRYVRCNGAFNKLLAELSHEKLLSLKRAQSSSEAYNIVSNWFYFVRYASFLFLEVYCNTFKPNWEDNIKYGWESRENYTKGAVLLTGTSEKRVLDKFLEQAKRDTGTTLSQLKPVSVRLRRFARELVGTGITRRGCLKRLKERNTWN